MKASKLLHPQVSHSHQLSLVLLTTSITHQSCSFCCSLCFLSSSAALSLLPLVQFIRHGQATSGPDRSSPLPPLTKTFPTAEWVPDAVPWGFCRANSQELSATRDPNSKESGRAIASFHNVASLLLKGTGGRWTIRRLPGYAHPHCRNSAIAAMR